MLCPSSFLIITITFMINMAVSERVLMLSEVDTVSADVEFPFTKGDIGRRRTDPMSGLTLPPSPVSVTSVHRASSPHLVAMVRDTFFEVEVGKETY